MEELNSNKAESAINLDDYEVKNVAARAYYVREWVSPTEERALLAAVRGAPRPKWTALSGRRVQSWGGTPHARGMLSEPLPGWLRALLARLPAGAPPRPNHVLVNEYRPGQGILPHEDGPLFHPCVATLSLGSSCVLRLWTAGRAPAGALLLEPRSLLLLTADLYTHHLHSIEELHADLIDDSICNLDLCSDRLLRVSVSRAARRACSAEAGHAAGGGHAGHAASGGHAGHAAGGGHAGHAAGGGHAAPGGGQEYAVMGVYETDSGYALSCRAEEMDNRCMGNLRKALDSTGGRLRLGQTLVVPAAAEGLAAVALAGLGPRDGVDGIDSLEQNEPARENVRVGVGAAVRALAGGAARGGGVVTVDCGNEVEADAAAEAATLAAWRFEEYKACADRSGELLLRPLESCDVANWERGVANAAAQNWARLLSDTPANRMTPVDLAQAALDVLCPLGCRVEAHDRAWLAAQNMQAFLAVARGSCEPPLLLEVAWDGPGADNGPLVLLAAKGVTFDSGGLCLKRPTSMVENRGSMAGAAVALAAVRAVAEQRVPIRLRLVAPLCENMISGQCMKVGDVVRALNGLSIQIEDTDMEGRLLLADALVYGQARYKPALVIDVATLTHGILLATGGGAFGCFTNSEALWRVAQRAGARTGDRPWRFPLWRYYHHKLVNDQSVDLRNKGSSKATPCLGAAFLRNFVCGDWMHMDITGVGKLAHAPAPPYLDPRRMTGRPTRTLALLLAWLARGQPDEAAAKR